MSPGSSPGDLSLGPPARAPAPAAAHTGPVTLAIVVSVLAVLLLIVGVVGTVYPILPGSMLILVTAIAWAWILGSGASWTFGVIAAGLAIAGMSASAVLTGRRLMRERVTRGPIAAGVVGAIVGFFVIPVVGLFLGFAVGLFGSQWARTRDARTALASSWGALKAMGLGMLVEFGCAMLALASVGVGILVHFVF